MKPHLLLIDALNLIRRIYAVDANQKHHSDEQMIQTCCARVAHACKKLLDTSNATHAIAVFDGDKSWRYHFYKDYKHSRAPMPQVLKDALLHFKAAIEETGIVVFEPINDEADDIIATLAFKASNNQITSTVVSTDKGFLPYIGPYITVYDYLAGDKTNDIPGVKGIGTKSAQQIVNNYNSIEQAAEDESLSPSIKAKLAANMDMYVISKHLVSLRTDINLGFSLKQLRLN